MLLPSRFFGLLSQFIPSMPHVQLSISHLRRLTRPYGARHLQGHPGYRHLREAGIRSFLCVGLFPSAFTKNLGTLVDCFAHATRLKVYRLLALDFSSSTISSPNAPVKRLLIRWP
ncbi:uncharacterized protein LAESUDRAFT_10089 [Laetiporus sulphureus 93-53]|uniref:Uncharacterized protein n=1 Tax=Laetiporus sulphureus 93-53 TaxID=1314785 RepID=A0A165I667_9APHY|nr:uncharacterized protein LAESUDRAFT_10089 [Laetiporus sulphureus 93-53]KZT12645.1 hypothetical protein LAESUDRAFT_10089 [Laetiporus sulphureus 93-53]